MNQRASHFSDFRDAEHEDGRATTIPVHPSTEIGGWLYHQILNQMGITEEEFRKLR